MVNKKDDTNVLKIVGIAAGVTAGIAAIAAGAFVAYRYFSAKKIKRACENCELNGECHCHGKYARHCKGKCICEELAVSEDEFSSEEENAVSFSEDESNLDESSDEKPVNVPYQW